MSLTRSTFCLGLLIVLSGTTALSQLGGGGGEMQQGVPSGAVPPMIGIPKGGAGILETRDSIIVYDQGRGKGKIISKTRTTNDRPDMTEFVIR